MPSTSSGRPQSTPATPRSRSPHTKRSSGSFPARIRCARRRRRASRRLCRRPRSRLSRGTTTPGDPMNFDIKTEQISDDAYVISLAGEVDLYTAPEFKQQLLEVIGQGGKQVIVDFTSTTFIDSTTVGVLVGGVKRLRTNDGQLSLVCSDRNITKIFEITGLDRVFTIYPTREEAVATLEGLVDQA